MAFFCWLTLDDLKLWIDNIKSAVLNFHKQYRHFCNCWFFERKTKTAIRILWCRHVIRWYECSRFTQQQTATETLNVLRSNLTVCLTNNRRNRQHSENVPKQTWKSPLYYHLAHAWYSHKSTCSPIDVHIPKMRRQHSENVPKQTWKSPLYYHLVQAWYSHKSACSPIDEISLLSARYSRSKQ